ncbi:MULTISPECIES: creatininase family protein [Ramlibacter]|uniref:Creatininase family protein n=1 Tax=Ramlibacter aquaticus TaxID=2780094 RepID=A0ABR9SJU5_9BURK|nr:MULTISPECIES: creatininase family protein [Ramlibacter]MBE7942630.1 creatininase family protein [Ramlibacter aquaticus]
MRWDELTWTEIPEVLAGSGHAAILPVGATEQHGPHLACGVDSVVAERLCLAVAGATRVPMLPTLAYGCSLGHSRRWPGTLALTPMLLIQLVEQVGEWAYHAGVRRLFIVNGHVTNAAPLRCALEMLRSRFDDLMVALLNTATLSERVRAFHAADAADWHANDAETSLMMAVAPQQVRPDRLGQGDDPDRTGGCVFSHPVNRTSANGTTGLPSLASEEKGRQWFDWMVEDLSALVRRGTVERPPLDASYFEPVADCRH